jgi:hypothetical protein
MKALTLFDCYNSDEEFRVEFMETYNKLISHKFEFYLLPSVFDGVDSMGYNAIRINGVGYIDIVNEEKFDIQLKNVRYKIPIENVKTIDDFIHIIKLGGVELHFKQSYINLVLNE